MKKRIALYTALLFIMLLICGCTAAVPVSSGETDGMVTSSVIPTVTVTGEGTLKLPADMATIRLGVQTHGDTAEAASQENALLMEQIQKAISDKGVSDEDMTSTDFYIYEDYDYNDNKIIGYYANNTLEVKIYDLDNTGAIVDAAVQAGANRSWGISFGLADPDAHKAELAALAADDALLQAQAYADALDMKLGKPVTVTTGSIADEVFITEEAVAEAPAENAAADEPQATQTPSTAFRPGTLTLNTSVTIRFRME